MVITCRFLSSSFVPDSAYPPLSGQFEREELGVFPSGWFAHSLTGTLIHSLAHSHICSLTRLLHSLTRAPIVSSIFNRKVFSLLRNTPSFIVYSIIMIAVYSAYKMAPYMRSRVPRCLPPLGPLSDTSWPLSSRWTSARWTTLCDSVCASYAAASCVWGRGNKGMSERISEQMQQGAWKSVVWDYEVWSWACLESLTWLWSSTVRDRNCVWPVGATHVLRTPLNLTAPSYSTRAHYWMKWLINCLASPAEYMLLQPHVNYRGSEPMW